MRASDQVGSKPEKNILEATQDKEIYETKHDEILVWIYQEIDTNKELVNRLFKIQDNDTIVRLQRTIEAPILGLDYRNNAIPIGFCDLRIIAFIKTELTPEQIESNKKDDNRCTYWLSEEERVIYFEVKTKINIGETIRQINFYKSKKHRSRWSERWFVVAPDSTHAKILEEQGIGFIPFKE